ncbi:hypothetical protein [Pedobacter hartonius]|uniref:Uncharacterized protein n=1 Tax=Pedobacter hartonius TaxID=425514 RepID=A0A1H4B3L4_9SPHI|nr:hypothetical protein [Pedobacter hartonius]SEA42750.1 hypothetical protein SAMN05443550_103197 [Pedobacter hartonius]
MESSYQIKLSPEQRESLAQDLDFSAGVLTEIIDEHADQLGYMLQAYYPREKVSRVMVSPGSMVIKDDGLTSMRLEYVLEEFSACSAIDTEQKDKMTVIVYLNAETGVLNLKGETWPEL